MAFSSCCVLIYSVAVAHVTAVHVPSLLHTAHRGQQALSLESEANSKCPHGKHSENPSILFMHIVKTGGSVMRQMLYSVLPPGGENFRMVDGLDPGHLTQNSKKDAFVIGLVRRPCDYMLSRYFMDLLTKTHSREQMEELGRNKDDFKDIVMKLTNGTLDSYQRHIEQWMMSTRIEERYGNKHNADCWMRTHSLKSDFIKCLGQFEACGGNVTVSAKDRPNVIEAVMHDVAKDMKENHERSVGNHPACTDMFDHEMLSSVLKTQQKVINEFDLGTCCSSDAHSLIHDDEIAELPPFFDLDWQID